MNKLYKSQGERKKKRVTQRDVCCAAERESVSAARERQILNARSMQCNDWLLARVCAMTMMAMAMAMALGE